MKKTFTLLAVAASIAAQAFTVFNLGMPSNSVNGDPSIYYKGDTVRLVFSSNDVEPNDNIRYKIWNNKQTWIIDVLLKDLQFAGGEYSFKWAIPDTAIYFNSYQARIHNKNVFGAFGLLPRPTGLSDEAFLLPEDAVVAVHDLNGRYVGNAATLPGLYLVSYKSGRRRKVLVRE